MVPASSYCLTAILCETRFPQNALGLPPSTSFSLKLVPMGLLLSLEVPAQPSQVLTEGLEDSVRKCIVWCLVQRGC